MSWPPTSLNDTQLANARIIAQVGRGLGASDRDVTIALMTALQESEMLNMKGGDRDSTGLFQQRNAWGSYADRMDPYKSAAMFFIGGQGGQRGLLDFKARDQMSLTQAAQAVQVSAYPDAYAKWAPLVSKYLPDVAGGAGAVSSTPSGATQGTAHTVTSANTSTPQSVPAPTGLSENSTAVPVSLPGAPAGLTPTAPAGLEGTAPAGLDGAAPAGVSSGMAPPVQPAQPSDSGVMTPEAFHATFPDAAATKMFSGAGSKLGMARRTDAVTTAMSYLGTPYRWGAASRSGVDCSGLIQQVYGAMGISLPRISYEQINAGKRTAVGDLKPGDLIGWDSGPRNPGVDHIALYAGGGRIIEAPRPGIAVRTRTLSQHEIATGIGAHFAQLD